MNVLMEDVKMAVKMYQDLISVHVHQASHRHMLGGNVKVGRHILCVGRKTHLECSVKSIGTSWGQFEGRNTHLGTM